MFRTSNPALSANTFGQVGRSMTTDVMSLQGTVNKTFVLLGLLLLTASYVWSKVTQPVLGYETMGQGYSNAAAQYAPYMMVGGIGGFIMALVTIFKKEWSSITAPIYALLEGLLIGGLSATFEMMYPGIVIQAVGLTFGTLFCLLMIYKSGMIKVTQNFRIGLFAATGAICLVYFVSFIMSFFGGSIPLIHSSGPFGIGFSLVVVTIAALNLVLDFDFIENGTNMGLPKYMEWYAAFGLMVTLIWLYIEILRLLAKLRDRR